MPDYCTLNDFVTACRHTNRASELWQNAQKFFKERKISMISYHSDDAQTPGSKPLGIVSEGFPEEWIRDYMEKELFLIDPIPKLASATSRPFLWTEVSQLTKLSAEGKRYMQILAKSGLGDGLAMQVYGPNMRNAFVGLGFGNKDTKLSAEEIFELHCGAQIAHIRYCELSEHRQRAPETLTPRESEILQWIARGKSNSVIADILGVSRHTVDTITRRIFVKLDVNDRTTAAIRGLGYGLVQHRRGGVL